MPKHSRNGPVTIKWLPGREPVTPARKFPFAATINGHAGHGVARLDRTSRIIEEDS